MSGIYSALHPAPGVVVLGTFRPKVSGLTPAQEHARRIPDLNAGVIRVPGKCVPMNLGMPSTSRITPNKYAPVPTPGPNSDRPTRGHAKRSGNRAFQNQIPSNAKYLRQEGARLLGRLKHMHAIQWGNGRRLSSVYRQLRDRLRGQFPDLYPMLVCIEHEHQRRF